MKKTSKTIPYEKRGLLWAIYFRSVHFNDWTFEYFLKRTWTN